MLKQTSELDKLLKRLSDLGDKYQRTYLVRTLSSNEVEQARGLMVEIRNAALSLHKTWDDFVSSNVRIEEVLDILGPDKPRQNDIAKFSTNLTVVCTVGASILRTLDIPLTCIYHYKRQCHSLMDSDAILRQQDATELESSVEKLVNHLRDDIESEHWYIQLVSLYAQTKLTSRIERLTKVLVILTIIVIIGTIIASVTGFLSLPT